jgi:hypothetical protein
LHASRSPADALAYAPGLWVSRVRIGGTIVRGSDKLAGTTREVLWRADASAVVVRYAAWCAERAAIHAAHSNAPDASARFSWCSARASQRAAHAAAIHDASHAAAAIHAADASHAAAAAMYALYAAEHAATTRYAYAAESRAQARWLTRELLELTP